MLGSDGDDDVSAVADKILEAFKRYDHCICVRMLLVAC
jgi:hypothetical protein